MAVIYGIRFQEPVVFHARNVGNYYLSELDYIPSQTLRGALLNSLISSGSSMRDDFYVSPAFPLGAAPAHAFMPAKSRKSSELVEVKGVIGRLGDNWKEELAKTFEEVKSIEAGSGGASTEKNAVMPKSKVGEIAQLRNETQGESWHYAIRHLRPAIGMHVAINKKTGTSEKGMLYAYEYKRIDEEMWAIASDDLGVSEIRVGKSRGKGAGRAEVAVIGKADLEEPEEGEWGYCLSQCVPSFLGRTYFEAEKVVGKKDLYAGWFTLGESVGTKPAIVTMSPGTLVKIRKRGDLDELKPAGLNFLVKIRDLGSFLSEVNAK
ncbi:hypothetical protein PQ610_06635 [Tardisphaera miroshnichenkoae]